MFSTVLSVKFLVIRGIESVNRDLFPHSFLAEAIKLDETNRKSARTDKDFDSIRNDERFNKLIGV